MKKSTAKKPAPRNAFYAQSGGVTAVINASAAGVIETAARYPEVIGKVYAGRNGIIGALTEDLIDTSRETAAAIRALPDLASRSEIVVVDDGSRDGTARVAASFDGAIPVRVVRLDPNRGKGAAVGAGIAAAREPMVAFTDAD